MRVLTVVVVGVALAGCAGGRCTENAQCPRGEACDVAYGVCEPPSAAGEYGRECTPGAMCPVGLSCASLGASRGMCLALSSTDCPAGTSPWRGGCARFCVTDADCHGTNECRLDPNTERRMCWLKNSIAIPASFGAACAVNSDCGDDPRTVCGQSLPGGMCTATCTSSSQCQGGGVPVRRRLGSAVRPDLRCPGDAEHLPPALHVHRGEGLDQRRVCAWLLRPRRPMTCPLAPGVGTQRARMWSIPPI